MFRGMDGLIHMTHRKADPDSFAGVYWGWRVFGGCTLVDTPKRSVVNVMERLGFSQRICYDYNVAISYDTNHLEDLPIVPERLILVDHHPWMDPRLEEMAEKVLSRKRSCLAMNLYDISRDSGYELPKDVLLAFALALLTDTAILRTAGSEELEYLSRFLNGRKMEEILEIAFEGAVDPRTFTGEVLSVEIFDGCDERVCVGGFSSEDSFMYFTDTFMYVMGCSVVVGVLDWGVWIYSKKSKMQRIYGALKILERGYRRRGGRIFGMRDPEEFLKILCGR